MFRARYITRNFARSYNVAVVLFYTRNNRLSTYSDKLCTITVHILRIGIYYDIISSVFAHERIEYRTLYKRTSRIYKKKIFFVFFFEFREIQAHDASAWLHIHVCFVKKNQKLAFFPPRTARRKRYAHWEKNRKTYAKNDFVVSQIQILQQISAWKYEWNIKKIK